MVVNVDTWDAYETHSFLREVYRTSILRLAQSSRNRTSTSLSKSFAISTATLRASNISSGGVGTLPALFKTHTIERDAHRSSTQPLFQQRRIHDRTRRRIREKWKRNTKWRVVDSERHWRAL